MADKQNNIDKSQAQAGQIPAEQAKETTTPNDIAQRRAEIQGKSGEVLMSDKPKEVGQRMSVDEGLKQYDQATGAVLDRMGDAIAEKKKWDPIAAIQEARARANSRGIALDKIQAQREAQQLKTDNLQGPDKVKYAEFQRQLAEKNAAKAKSNASEFGTWLASPFIAVGESLAAVGLGAGAGLGGLFRGLLEQRDKYKRERERKALN